MIELADLNCGDNFALIRIFIRKHIDNCQRVKDNFITFCQTGMLLDRCMRTKAITLSRSQYTEHSLSIELLAKRGNLLSNIVV